jgi:hypothetical protein
MSKILTVYNWGSKLKKSFDRSAKKNGSSQQGDDNRDETNDTTIETRRLCTQENC